MNYGAPEQEVVKGYGPASVSNLQALKEKYDPTDVFGTLVKGGFKIPGYGASL